jgi:hypothetical protein
MIFLDTQMLLQILYDNIKDKSRVLTSKRIVRTRLIDGGVGVIASDGTSISGDILVGADGIHSTVRQEMWRLATNVCPKLFDAREQEGKGKPSDIDRSELLTGEAPPCDNSCIFGISNTCYGIGPGDIQADHYVMNLQSYYCMKHCVSEIR